MTKDKLEEEIEQDEIRELKNMHTKGELAKMYLNQRKEDFEMFEKMIKEIIDFYENNGDRTFLKGFIPKVKQKLKEMKK